jgi:hypothetical protein
LLEFIGFLVTTGALTFFTWWFGATLWFQHAVAGLDMLDWKDWLFALVPATMIVVGWWLWWEHIGSKINVTFG